MDEQEKIKRIIIPNHRIIMVIVLHDLFDVIQFLLFFASFNEPL